MKRMKLKGLVLAALIIAGGWMLSNPEAQAATKNPDFDTTHLDYYEGISIEDYKAVIDNAYWKGSIQHRPGELTMYWTTCMKYENPEADDPEYWSYTEKQSLKVIEGFDVYVYKDKKWKKIGTKKASDKAKKIKFANSDSILYGYKFTCDTSKWISAKYQYKVVPWGYADEQGGRYTQEKVYGKSSKSNFSFESGNYAKNALKLKSVKSKKAGTITIKYADYDGKKFKYPLDMICSYEKANIQIYVSTDKNFRKNVKKYSTKELSSYTIKGLKKGKTYYVKMRVKRWDTGEKAIYSQWSNVKKVKVKSK